MMPAVRTQRTGHGLLWLPLLLAFVLLAALGWLERRRQSLFPRLGRRS